MLVFSEEVSPYNDDSSFRLGAIRESSVPMALPARLVVELTQAQIALLIAAVELVIAEMFKSATEYGFSWHRRWTLYKKGRFCISSRPFANSRHTIFLNVVLVAFLTVVVFLELSVEEIYWRTKRTLCFGPSRWKRYLTRSGPKQFQLIDDRIGPYIVGAGCDERLFANVLQGPTAIDRGYPKCLPAFGEIEDIAFKATLQGCGVGYIARSLDGDYHCDLLPVEELERTENKLEGSNFLGIYRTARRASSSYFVTETVPASRYISNTAIPDNFVRRRLPVTQKATLRCENNSLDCYNRVRPALLPLRKTRHFYDLGNKIVFIKALERESSSSICVLSTGNVTLFWSYLSHTIPGTDRSGREGPVLTDLTLNGRGRCNKNLSPITARLYYDSIENLSLGMKHKPEGDSGTPSLDLTDPVMLLKAAAVVKGLKMRKAEATICDARLVKGSSVDTGKFITALVFSLFLVSSSLCSLCFAAYAKRTCNVRIDPLDPLWPINYIVHSGLGTLSSGGFKRYLEVDGDWSSSAGSRGNSSESLSAETTNDIDLPPVPLAEMGQWISRPRQSRPVPLTGSGGASSPKQAGPGRIRLRSPIRFPLVNDVAKSVSSIPPCVSRRISFRSPIVYMTDALDDDLWIGIQEDPERKVGRYVPHAFAKFESWNNYPGRIE